MEEKNESKVDDHKENEDAGEKIQTVAKRERFLRIIIFILLSVVILCLAGMYLIYLNYKKISKTMEEVATNIEKDLPQDRDFEEIIQNARSLSTSAISLENTSLSKVGGLSKEFIENTSKEENIKKLQEVVDDYYDDPAINQFIEEFKNDPDMKDIFEAPPQERPMKMVKKMNDPKFMQRMTQKLISNPHLLQSLMRMSADPRIQQMINQNLTKEGVKPKAESKK